MSLINQQAYENAKRERALIRDWLLEMMKQSPIKPATKDVLREIAIKKFRVSKHSFDAGWIWAIEDSSNHHWYDPLPRRKKIQPS